MDRLRIEDIFKHFLGEISIKSFAEAKDPENLDEPIHLTKLIKIIYQQAKFFGQKPVEELNNKIEFVLKECCLEDPLSDLYIRSEGKFLTVFIKELEALFTDNNLPFDHLKSVFPRVYYFDENKSIIIRENFVSKGYHSRKLKDVHTLDEAKLVLSNLAKFHGSSYVLIKKFGSLNEFLQTHPYLKEKRHFTEIDQNLVKYRWELFYIIMEIIESVSDTKCKRIYEILSKYSNNVERTCSELVSPESGPNSLVVVNHGDVWNKYVLFHEQDPKVAFVHFHTTRVASPCIDLSFYLLISTRQEVKENWNELLKFYYAVFKDQVEKLNCFCLHTFEDLKQDFYHKSKYGLLSGIPICLGHELLEYLFSLYSFESDVNIKNEMEQWFIKNPESQNQMIKNLEKLIDTFLQFGEL